MAWIEVHQDLQNHPKVLMLRNKSGLPLDTALGRILQLWLWGLAYASDGDLRKYDPRMVEEVCSIPMMTLIDVGLVDKKPYLRLHDWWDYAGHYLKIKFKNYPEKWQRIQKLYEQKLGNPKNSLRTLTNQPNQPNQPTRPREDSLWEVWFNEFWQEYPRKLGKPEAVGYFKDQILVQKDFQNLMQAVRNYKAEIAKLGTDEKYIKHGSTFLSKERWKDYQNGTYDSPSRIDLKALARSAREAKNARENANTGTVSTSVRNTNDVQDESGRDNGGTNQ